MPGPAPEGPSENPERARHGSRRCARTRPRESRREPVKDCQPSQQGLGRPKSLQLALGGFLVGSPSFEKCRVNVGSADGDRSVNGKNGLVGDIPIEQRRGCKSAGVGERRQTCGECQPSRDAHRGLERRRHDARETGCLGDVERPANAPQRLHLEHHDVGGLQSCDASGSSAVRTDSSAARGTSVLRRRIAISSSVATGCSTYSSSYRSSVLMALCASSTDQAPFASTRILPFGPSASRTASTRASSVREPSPGSATLTFAVEHDDLTMMS